MVSVVTLTPGPGVPSWEGGAEEGTVHLAGGDVRMTWSAYLGYLREHHPAAIRDRDVCPTCGR